VRLQASGGAASRAFVFASYGGGSVKGVGVVAVAGRPWRGVCVCGVSGRRGVRGSATLCQPHIRARGGGVRTLVCRGVRSSVIERPVRGGRLAHRRKRGRSCVRDARTAAPPRRARPCCRCGVRWRWRSPIGSRDRRLLRRRGCRKKIRRCGNLQRRPRGWAQASHCAVTLRAQTAGSLEISTRSAPGGFTRHPQNEPTWRRWRWRPALRAMCRAPTGAAGRTKDAGRPSTTDGLAPFPRPVVDGSLLAWTPDRC
jgi:hypothetical protein